MAGSIQRREERTAKVAGPDEAPLRALDRLCRPALFASLLAASGLLLSLWFMNGGLPPNDEGALLTNAAKILQGRVFYRDIDAYPFPAAPYLLALAMRLFGEHLSVARGLAALLFVVVLLALYAAALPVLGRARAALYGLSLLAFKFLAWPAYTAYTYSDLSFAGACVACAALMAFLERPGGALLLLAGAATAVSIAAKQNLGLPLAGAIGAVLLFPGIAAGAARDGAARLRDAGIFAAGAAALLLPAFAYFALQGLAGHLLASGLYRPFTGYLPTSSISFLEPLVWWRWGSLREMPAFPYFPGAYWSLLVWDALPSAALRPIYWSAGELFSRLLYTSVPLLFALAWLRARRAAPGAGRLRALSLLALAALLSAFPRADFFHLVSVYPLLLLLGFALLPAGERSAATRRLAVAVALALLLSGALSVAFQQQFRCRVELPRAELAVRPQTAWVEPIVRYLEQELAPGEPFLVYGHEAYYYFLADRYSAWPFAQLYPGQEGSDGGRALVELLEREPPRLIVRGMLNWPALPLLPRYAPRLQAFVSEHYELDPGIWAQAAPGSGEPPPPGVIAVLRRRSP
jgi:hypothetical protein